MPLSMEQARVKLRALEAELNTRQADIRKYENYYKGKHKLVYASDEFRTWWEDKFSGFADNWCAPVVDAATERRKLHGIRPRDAEKIDTDLQRAWEESGAQADSKLGFQTSAITGRSFVMVWGDEDGEPEITFEHPSYCIVAYKPGSRRKRDSAAKIWQEGNVVYGNLYTEDGIYKFEKSTLSTHPGTERKSVLTSTGTFWLPDNVYDWTPRTTDAPEGGGSEPWPVPNPMGKVPMVELQNRPQLDDEPLNEISGVAAMQDAINSLWSYLFTSADYAAMPQRVILGAQLPKLPILDSQGKKIGEQVVDIDAAHVKRIIALEGPDAKIDSWEAANLSIFTDVIEKAVGHVAAQTRTPIYYFASSIQNISGDTLKALDAGLVAKIRDRIEFDSETMKDVFELVALVKGETAKAKAIRGGTVQWADYENRSDAQAMDRLSKMLAMGFPFEYIVEQFTGGDADEVARIMAMRKDEAENDPLSVLNQQLLGAQAQEEGQGREQAAADARSKGSPDKTKKTGGSDNGGTDGSGRKPR